MKWPQGLAVITRAEHWDLASQHLWGLSSSDIAAFLHSSPAFPSPELPRTESCSDIKPDNLSEGYRANPESRKTEAAMAARKG